MDPIYIILFTFCSERTIGKQFKSMILVFNRSNFHRNRTILEHI